MTILSESVIIDPGGDTDRIREAVNEIGMDKISLYENALLEYGTRLFKDIKGVRIIGNAREKASLISFHIEGCLV